MELRRSVVDLKSEVHSVDTGGDLARQEPLLDTDTFSYQGFLWLESTKYNVFEMQSCNL
jgi:hypothetical protein